MEKSNEKKQGEGEGQKDQDDTGLMQVEQISTLSHLKTVNTDSKGKEKKKYMFNYGDRKLSFCTILQGIAIIIVLIVVLYQIVEIKQTTKSFEDEQQGVKESQKTVKNSNQYPSIKVINNTNENIAKKIVQAVQTREQGSKKIETKISSNQSVSAPQFDGKVKPFKKFTSKAGDPFSLWDLSPSQKAELLKRYQSLPENKKSSKLKSWMQINYGKDEQFSKFAPKFEATTEVIDWSSLKLTEKEQEQIQENFKASMAKRMQAFEGLLKKYRSNYLGKTGFVNPQKKRITYQQFLDNIEYQTLVGQDYKSKPELLKIYQREKQYFQQKYDTDKYPEQIPACIVAPSYKNNINFRYIWHVESVIQQDYSNYKLIIIDDNSPDQTGEVLSKYLRWRNFPKQKIVLLRNSKQRFPMQNIYYAVHKYCDYNQIFYIVDGDDQMLGTQTLKLCNAIYQKEKLYTMYSNYLSYDYKNQTQPIVLGLSEAYPQQVIDQGNFRVSSHAYSHLRTMMSDIFLFESEKSLQDWRGRFYSVIGDNAQYFPAMEMSCGRLNYLTELRYWYTANTGINEWRNPNSDYGPIHRHIANQKHYTCINDVFQAIIEAVQGESH